MLHYASILLVVTGPLLETTSVSSRQEVMQLSHRTAESVYERTPVFYDYIFVNKLR
jgi:hypothetical protein